MRTLVAGLVGISIAVTTASPVRADEPADTSIDEHWLDELVQEQVLRLDVPGALAAFVRDGEVRLARGYGFASVDDGWEADERTLFRVGSISKLFVWTSLFRLAEEGKLSLDDDINLHLCGQAVRSGHLAPIRVRHLMDHTAGFDPDARWGVADDPTELTSLQSFIAQELPAVIHIPGKVDKYTNLGACVAARVVECVSGQSFENYLEQNTFQPLGMRDATFMQPLPPHKEPAMAKGYVRESGRLQDRPFELLRHGPAAAMSASARDMAAFLLALLGEHPEWIAEDALERLRSDTYAPSPHLESMAHGFFVKQIGGLRVFYHSGSTHLFSSLFLFVPERRIGLFVSYNGSDRGDAFDEVMDGVSERLGTPSRPPQPVRWDVPASVEGFYRSGRVARRFYADPDTRRQEYQVRRKGDGILVERGRWYPIAPWVFHQQDGTHVLVFDVNDRGEVERFRVKDSHALTFERVEVTWGSFESWIASIVLGTILFPHVIWPIVLLAKVGWRDARRRKEFWGTVSTWVAAVLAFAVLVTVSVYAHRGTEAWRAHFRAGEWGGQAYAGFVSLLGWTHGTTLWAWYKWPALQTDERRWSRGWIVRHLLFGPEFSFKGNHRFSIASIWQRLLRR